MVNLGYERKIILIIVMMLLAKVMLFCLGVVLIYLAYEDFVNNVVSVWTFFKGIVGIVLVYFGVSSSALTVKYEKHHTEVW